MKQYVYIIDYELKRKFGNDIHHPVCVYGTFEAAKKRVDELFDRTFNDMKAHLNPDEYTFEENCQEWDQEKIIGDAEGWCYTRQALSMCDAAAAMFGDEIADDLQISVFKSELHPE